MVGAGENMLLEDYGSSAYERYGGEGTRRGNRVCIYVSSVHNKMLRNFIVMLCELLVGCSGE